METKKAKCDCNRKSSRTSFPAKVRAKVRDFERVISFMPGYRCTREPNDPKNHGIHGTDLSFVLIGEKAAVQFVIYTGWMAPGFVNTHPFEKMIEGMGPLGQMLKGAMVVSSPLPAIPAGITIHAREPMEEDSDPSLECPWLNGADCYAEHNFGLAKDAFDVLNKDGEEALWFWLEELYYERLAASESARNDG